VIIGNPEDGLDGPLFFLGGHLFLSETLLHFGPQHPLLELRFHPLLGRLLGQFETLPFEGHPLLGLVAFAQGDQAGGELLQSSRGRPSAPTASANRWAVTVKCSVSHWASVLVMDSFLFCRQAATWLRTLAACLRNNVVNGSLAVREPFDRADLAITRFVFMRTRLPASRPIVMAPTALTALTATIFAIGAKVGGGDGTIGAVCSSER
jgi:hypothetical protein